jgi:DASS family divalent anion:Na+ symporter
MKVTPGIHRLPPIGKFSFCAIIAVVLWQFDTLFDVSPQGWHIFSVFMAVIISFILRPYPMGMMVLISLITLVATKNISLKESLSGFGDTTVWLVISAFLIAGAVLDTGFGRRVSLWLVVKLGKSLKGLAYAVCGSEFLLGPVIPSNTARGGGIHAPIVNSLSHSLGSTPSHHPERAGRFLSLVGSHANLIAASMYMTGMAANPLVSRAAEDIFGVEFGWGTWALGAILPGVLSLLLLPQLIYRLTRPGLKDGRAAQRAAREELAAIGGMSGKEKVMMTVLILMLGLWSTSFLHGMSTALVAWLGVLALLLSGTQTWEDIIGNDRAWDTLIWLGGLLTMANMLSDYGFIEWFVRRLEMVVAGMSGLLVVITLGIFYFYSMYAFSMLTAHIAAMAAPFLAVCLAAGAEPMIAIAVIAYFSCLCGCTTNYSSGPVIIYFGLGYVPASGWFNIGFIVSLFHLALWIGSGLLWWKILGWW